MHPAGLSLLIGSFLILEALTQSRGHFGVRPLIMLCLAQGALAFALFKTSGVPSNKVKIVFRWLLVGLIFRQFFSLCVRWPIGEQIRQTNFPSFLHTPQFFVAAIGTVALATFFCFVVFPKKYKIGFWFGVASFLVLAGWVFIISPSPHIDVFVAHKQAAEFLASGRNPYGATIPNIYGHTDFFGPGMVENGRVALGYPYPPVSLLLVTAGNILFHEPRAFHALLLAAAAIALYKIRPSREAALASLLLLFQSTTHFVLEQSWTEVVTVGFLFLLLYSIANKMKGATIVWLALFVSAKQYNFLMLPFLYPLLQEFFRPRDYLKSVAIAAVVSLPFVLVDVPAFFRDVLFFQLNQPFRQDALSVSALVFRKTGFMLSPLVGFVLFLSVAIALQKLRPQRGLSGQLAAAAFSLLFFFLFNKQAFCNYYFLISSIVIGSVALVDFPNSNSDLSSTDEVKL